jgi:hypothetical protein
LRRWPMRKARSVAWFSTAGFHQRSKWITWEAAVRLSPVPPARRDRTKKGTVSSAWKRSTRARAERQPRRGRRGQGGPRAFDSARLAGPGGAIFELAQRNLAMSDSATTSDIVALEWRAAFLRAV